MFVKAVGLGGGVAVAMLGEIQAFFLRKGGAQIAGLADQPRLALLADAAAKDRFDEQQAVTVDHRLDLVFGRIGSKHFGRGKADMGQQPRTREHSGHLHRGSSCGLECWGKP